MLISIFKDLSEFFEDNVQKGMPRFHSLLTLKNSLLVTDDDEPGVLGRAAVPDLRQHRAVRVKVRERVPAIHAAAVRDGRLEPPPRHRPQQQVRPARLQRHPVSRLRGGPPPLQEPLRGRERPEQHLQEGHRPQHGDEGLRRGALRGQRSDVDTRRRATCDLAKGLSRQKSPKSFKCTSRPCLTSTGSPRTPVNIIMFNFNVLNRPVSS